MELVKIKDFDDNRVDLIMLKSRFGYGFGEDLYFYRVSREFNLSENFILKYFGLLHKDLICRYQNLSQEFIIKNCDKLNLKIIKERNIIENIINSKLLDSLIVMKKLLE